MVMHTSEAWTASPVRILGVSAEMSMPTSFIASTAAGLTRSAGVEPAERTVTRSPARWVRNPAAIWERPALWTQTNRTLGLSDMIWVPIRDKRSGAGSRDTLDARISGDIRRGGRRRGVQDDDQAHADG